jgi:hypothetical protein
MGEDLDDTVIVNTRASVPTGREPDLADTVLTAGRPSVAPSPGVATATEATGRTTIGAYSIRVGLEGAPIPLDVPCHVGRNPAPPRVVDGPAPRLVRVESPGREVSSTHLEVRQVGSSVVVRDLRSTNGSIVMVPGSAPRTLRQGESVVVSPGTLVDLGDDIILQILPMQRSGSGATGRQQ